MLAAVCHDLQTSENCSVALFPDLTFPSVSWCYQSLTTPTSAGASKSPGRSWPSARTRVKVLDEHHYQNTLPWPFQISLWNGLCTLKFSLKPTPGVHKRSGKLMVSMECETPFSASFTQETRSWLWPMRPRWRPAPARYEASLRRTQKTLSKSSGRSLHRVRSRRSLLFISSPFHRCKHLCPLLRRFHTWGFVPVRKWERPGCGSWWTHPSCLWRTDPITASAGGRCSCRTEMSASPSFGSNQLLDVYFNPHCCTSPKKKAHSPCFRQRQACRHLCF